MDKSSEKDTEQYLVYYKTDDDKLLNRRMYIAGSPKEAAMAFTANTPHATWVEVFKLESVLVNEFTA